MLHRITIFKMVTLERRMMFYVICKKIGFLLKNKAKNIIIGVSKYKGVKVIHEKEYYLEKQYFGFGSGS